jgi:hypothetical protein
MRATGDFSVYAVIYLTCTMALGTISVCLTVMVLNFHHRDSEQPVPEWARVFVLVHLARVLRIAPRSSASECLVDVSSHSQASAHLHVYRVVHIAED